MSFLKLKINSTILTIILAFYFTFILNMTLMRHIYNIFLDMDHLGFMFVLSVIFFFLAALNIIFLLFSIKYIEKPLFILVIILSSFINYAMYNYGIIFNADMFTNIFETNVAESHSYLNLTLVIWIFLSGIVPAFLLLKTEIIHYEWKKDILVKIGSLLVSIAIIGIIAIFFYKDFASIGRNNRILAKEIIPTYYISGLYKYIRNTYFHKDIPYNFIGEDAVVPDNVKNNLMIVVVGETARSMNYELNGYDRPTNAYTRNIENITSFQKVTSCGTATAISVPCMFSMMNREDYSRAKFKNQDNVADILKRAGIEQLWVDNNSSCKGVCRNIKNISVSRDTAPYCDGKVCKDEVFFKYLQSQINDMKGKNGIIYLHIMGSHGPTYYKRYFEKDRFFKPDCQRSDIQNCTDEEIVNTYDNTILYTDKFLAHVIDILKENDKDFNSLMFYISDHGESLGENGLYLHGMPYMFAPEQQTKIPLITWFSDKMIKEQGIDMDCLKKLSQQKEISHDNLSHSLLGLMHVKTNAYKEDMDIFAACRKEK